MINCSIWLNFESGFSKLGVFCYKLYVQFNSWFLKYNWIVLTALEHASCVYSVHASYRVIFSIVVFYLTLSNAVFPWFSLFFCWFLFCLSFHTLSIMVRKTRAHSTSTCSSTPAFDRDRFQTKKNQETYNKLNIFRSV